MDSSMSSPSSSTPTPFSALQNNHLILGHILSYLDLPSLKNSRLVCTHWEREATKRLPHFDLVLHLQPPLFHATATASLFQLLDRGQGQGQGHPCHLLLHPTLYLSLQTPAWARRRTKFKDNEDFNGYLNASQSPRPDPATLDPKVVQIVGKLGTGPWISDLRLELTLMEARDAQLVVDILARLPHLRKFCLDILDLGEEGLLGFPAPQPQGSGSKAWLPPSLVSLGLRVARGAYLEGGHGVEFPAILYFMSTLTCSSSSLQFLDLEGREFRGGFIHDRIIQDMLMRAMASIMVQQQQQQQQNPGSDLSASSKGHTLFPRLAGLRDDIHDVPVLDTLVATFPRPLRRLHLTCSKARDVVWLYKLGQLLRRHAPSLEVLEVEAFIGMCPLLYEDEGHIPPGQGIGVEEEQLVGFQITLPYLPLLTSLTLHGQMGGWSTEKWSLEVWNDISLNLRHILLDGPLGLRRHLPSLTTLTVFVRSEAEIWEHIFPAMTPGGERLEFHQIKVLNISLIVEEDCGHPSSSSSSSCQLSRLHSIFPSLITLRHVGMRRSGSRSRSPQAGEGRGTDLQKPLGTLGTCKHVRSPPPPMRRTITSTGAEQGQESSPSSNCTIFPGEAEERPWMWMGLYTRTWTPCPVLPDEEGEGGGGNYPQYCARLRNLLVSHESHDPSFLT